MLIARIYSHAYFARIYADPIVNRRQLEYNKNAIKFDRKKFKSLDFFISIQYEFVVLF